MSAEPRWPAEPLDVVAAHWQQQPFLALFNVAVEALDEGYARIGVNRDDMPLRGVRDSINGGVVGSLGETAARLCLTTQLTPEEILGATHEVSVSFLTSARGEHTVAEARLLRRGRRVAVADVELRDTADGAINAKIRVSMGIGRAGGGA